MKNPTRYVINVSDSVIKRAKPRSPGHCLIAEGIRDSIKDAYSINVNVSHASFNRDNIRYTYPVPARIAILAAQFDSPGFDKTSLKPFKFQFGTNGSIGPVIKRGPLLKARKKRPRKTSKPRIQCIRRYRPLLKETSS